MRLGVTMFATDQSMDVVELAREAEARGFDSLYLPEHTHIPVSRRTPPPTGDAELAEEYKRTLDPVRRPGRGGRGHRAASRLGTGIVLPAQREPIVTAKAIATLDHLVGRPLRARHRLRLERGRAGDHGVAMARPARRRAASTCWPCRRCGRDDVAGFDGDHVDLAPSWSWPKPAQPATVRRC